ncbi:MAG: hypothetical protein Q8Q16_07505 [Betaproteobacteria bacterium]|nr:hypothetical protein [Betaproteobacteria bacterium]
MKTQKQQGGARALVDQPAPVRKKNAWWRRLKIGRAQRRYAYVISEGAVWFGRKTPDQKAFIWISAEEFLGQTAANDEVYGNTK